jgi:hypothetical protein
VSRCNPIIVSTAARLGAAGSLTPVPGRPRTRRGGEGLPLPTQVVAGSPTRVVVANQPRWAAGAQRVVRGPRGPSPRRTRAAGPVQGRQAPVLHRSEVDEDVLAPSTAMNPCPCSRLNHVTVPITIALLVDLLAAPALGPDHQTTRMRAPPVGDRRRSGSFGWLGLPRMARTLG